jgi:hypothetical protein
MSTYTPISTQTLSSAVTSITFSDIPQNYTDLVLVVGNFGMNISGSAARLRFNGDTGNNYSNTTVVGNGTVVGSGRESSQNSMRIIGASIGPGTANNDTTIIHILNYASTTVNKTVLVRASLPLTDVYALVGLWRNTVAVNSITLRSFNDTHTFNSGSTFTLYGIGSGSPKAFGGDIVTTDGTYWYHAFTSSGVFAPMQNFSCDVLVVAGGGGGGQQFGGGGGGAGGLRATALSLTNNAYTITVGAGGAGGTGGGGKNGTKGSDSLISGSDISTFTSTGGGFGGFNIGGNGGSGGGGGGRTDFTPPNGDGGISEPVTSPVQGFAGGRASNSGPGTNGGGGGGGAGGVGPNSGSGTGANGGIGSNAYSSWATATSTGVSGYYAGGGAGHGYTSPANTGGLGGGGNGATSGTVNTGGGGGGSVDQSSFAGAGGSGIVIVRYAV